MSEKVANFIMILSITFLSLPSGMIISEWITEKEIFFSEQILSNIVLLIFGLVLFLVSLLMKIKNRKIMLSLLLLAIPMVVSIHFIFIILWYSNHDLWMITVFLVATMMTVLAFLFLYRLGVFAKDATDQSVFKDKRTRDDYL